MQRLLGDGDHLPKPGGSQRSVLFGSCHSILPCSLLRLGSDGGRIRKALFDPVDPDVVSAGSNCGSNRSRSVRLGTDAHLQIGGRHIGGDFLALPLRPRGPPLPVGARARRSGSDDAGGR